jgi:hypothetical protein
MQNADRRLTSMGTATRQRIVEGVATLIRDRGTGDVGDEGSGSGH